MATQPLARQALRVFSMPEMDTLLDRVVDDADLQRETPLMTRDEGMPASGWQAIGRGMIGHCPRCGSPGLFRAFLKPVDTCPVCHQDWSLQRADDFPAYVSIFVTGHIMAPIIIALISNANLSFWALTVVVLLMAVVLMIGTLQPAKGGIIALQWWFEMHGFTRAPAAADHEATPPCAEDTPGHGDPFPREMP